MSDTLSSTTSMKYFCNVYLITQSTPCVCLQRHYKPRHEAASHFNVMTATCDLRVPPQNTQQKEECTRTCHSSSVTAIYPLFLCAYKK